MTPKFQTWAFFGYEWLQPPLQLHFSAEALLSVVLIAKAARAAGEKGAKVTAKSQVYLEYLFTGECFFLNIGYIFNNLKKSVDVETCRLKTDSMLCAFLFGGVGWGALIKHSFELAHVRHGTLVNAPFNLHTCVMLRYCRFSCACVHT